MVSVDCDGHVCPSCGSSSASVLGWNWDYIRGPAKWICVPALVAEVKGEWMFVHCQACESKMCAPCAFQEADNGMTLFGGEVESCEMCGKLADGGFW